MSDTLKPLLEDFHEAILQKDLRKIAPEIKPHPRMSALEQFSVYGEGYRIRLLAVLKENYPGLASLIGDKRFDALAKEFIEYTPPRYFNIDTYPLSFADYLPTQKINAFEHEIAAIEQAIATAYMAPESSPLAPATLNNLRPEQFAQITLALRGQLLTLAHNSNDWLNAQRGGQPLPAPIPAATHLYIYRHENSVRRVVLSEAEFAVLANLQTGMAIGDALDLENFAGEITANISFWFGNWLESGFFCDKQ